MIIKHRSDIRNLGTLRQAKHLISVLTLTALLFCLTGQYANAQVQCLSLKNDKNGLLLVKNHCNDNIVVEVKIDSPDFSNHRCFSSELEIYPCRELVTVNSKVQIQVPIGELQGGYRACYQRDVGTSACEFK